MKLRSQKWNLNILHLISYSFTEDVCAAPVIYSANSTGESADLAACTRRGRIVTNEYGAAQLFQEDVARAPA